ncbi:MAG: M28 family peptidase, partial [Myxococcales bacterium]|nr:M28 family peptidase [Myxococcales bacterium]
HANVVATLEATTPSDEYIIVGAHYDTVWGSPGAVDNGSGVAIVIAAADYLRHVKTRALNVMFVLFDEEEGVAYHEEYDYGAVNFITWFKDQELGTLHSAHTADMVSGWAGNPDVLYMHLVNNFYINLYTTALKRLRDAHGDALPLLNTMSIAGGTRGASDHYPFRAEGVDAFQLSSNSDRDLHPTWHSSADVAGVVNFEYLQAATLTTSAAIGGLLVCPN